MMFQFKNNKLYNLLIKQIKLYVNNDYKLYIFAINKEGVVDNKVRFIRLSFILVGIIIFYYGITLFLNYLCTQLISDDFDKNFFGSEYLEGYQSYFKKTLMDNLLIWSGYSNQVMTDDSFGWYRAMDLLIEPYIFLNIVLVILYILVYIGHYKLRKKYIEERRLIIYLMLLSLGIFMIYFYMYTLHHFGLEIDRCYEMDIMDYYDVERSVFIRNQSIRWYTNTKNFIFNIDIYLTKENLLNILEYIIIKIKYNLVELYSVIMNK